MIVQIVRAFSPQFWYSKHIAKIPEVVEKGENYMLKEDPENEKALKRKLIGKNDYGIIEK